MPNPSRGSTAKTLSVVVRVAASHGDEQFESVVSALRQAGLRQVESQKRFLTVHGIVDADKLDALVTLSGVASVREGRNFSPS